MKAKQILKSLFSILIFAAIAVGEGILMCQTSDAKVSEISRELVNPNIPSNPDDIFTKSPIFQVSANNHPSNNKYDLLFNNYYYNINTKGVRQFLTNDFKYHLSAGNDLDINVYYQPTFSVEKEAYEEHTYYMDYQLFSSYYSDDILGERQYLRIRFGCEGFTFISDTFADKLVEKYGLKDHANPYEELIRNEAFAVLHLDVDGGQRTTKLCINNIIYSTKRYAPYVSTFGENFILTYYPNATFTSFSSRIEIDLMNSYFASYRVLNGLFKNDFLSDDYTFGILAYDTASSSYVERLDLASKAVSLNDKYNILFLTSYAFIMVASGVLLYLVYEKFGFDGNNKLLFLLIFTIVLTLASLVGYFISFYSLVTLYPLAIYALYIIFRWKEVSHETRKLLAKANKYSKK